MTSQFNTLPQYLMWENNSRDTIHLIPKKSQVVPMQANPLDMILALLYPYLGLVFLGLGILTSIWFVVKVESDDDIPLTQLALTIVIMGLLLGFGIQLTLVTYIF